MIILFDNRQSFIEITDEITDILKIVIETALKVEHIKDEYEVSVSFVTPEEIQNINSEFRGKNFVTDVLSFPMEDEFSENAKILGDIILCVERANEQAIEYGHSFLRELAYLTCHSTFHLLGYDHMEDAEKKIMRSKEKQVMKEIKLFKNSEGREMYLET